MCPPSRPREDPSSRSTYRSPRFPWASTCWRSNPPMAARRNSSASALPAESLVDGRRFIVVRDRLLEGLSPLLVLAVMPCTATAAGIAQRPASAPIEHTVNIDARVVDAKGAPIGGLTAGDFDVREDGVLVSLARLRFV